MELQTYEIEHKNKLRNLAAECCVLLKKDGTFPLKDIGKIAIYGNGARHTIKGGTGSGDVNVRHYVTIEEGLENAGFTITTKKWMDAYDKRYSEAKAIFSGNIKAKIAEQGISAIMLGIGAVMPEPEYEFPINGEGDTAIYVLSRISGEGSDRQPVKGDFMLSDTETRDILAISKKYDKFMLVINAAGVVDISPVLDKIGNVLLISQPGMTVGDTFTDILLGKSYPSGKLTSSWANYESYCKEGDFAEEDDTRYREGIYVGYRYFETISQKTIFPFGYGLTYTDFELNFGELQLEQTKVVVTVTAKNIGVTRGKEVVQIYVTKPVDSLHQPYLSLAAYQKTSEILPGENRQLEVTFDMKNLASFSEMHGAYLLERGDYVIWAGTNCENVEAIGIIALEDEILISKVAHVGGKADFEDSKILRSSTVENKLSRIRESLKKSKKCYSLSKEYFINTPKINFIEDDADIERLVKELSVEELAKVCVGGFKDEGSNSFIGNAAYHVAGAAGETTSILEEKGIPHLVMADGPAGLRLNRQYGIDENGVYPLDDGNLASIFELLPEEMIALLKLQEDKPDRQGKVYNQYCSAIPVGTAIAQSWNEEVAEAFGELVGEEMELFNVDLWLAPALNIHRNPLCGRNFEYFSEDPLISGKIAAAITKGVQKHPGKGVTIKHFVANNQETNRMRSNSIMSERTLREIYLKGFEIAVKEGNPLTVMTSYNLLNGEHTSSRRDLMEIVLRREWGFSGVVMTDWVTQGLAANQIAKYPMANAPGAIAAGNDLMMPGGKLDVEDLLAALSERVKGYRITREDLETCAARILTLVKKIKTGK